jgi:hypothetical protein
MKKFEKPTKRMTLRERMTHAEKYCRDLIDHANGELLAAHTEYRDLTRPVRRKSHYPTRTAMQNALAKLHEASGDANAIGDFLMDELKFIRDSAQREIRSR